MIRSFLLHDLVSALGVGWAVVWPVAAPMWDQWDDESHRHKKPYEATVALCLHELLVAKSLIKLLVPDFYGC